MADHCNSTPPFYNGIESPHTDTCSQNFTNVNDLFETYSAVSGVSWNNVGDCGSYFVDFGSCSNSRTFFNVPWYDHTNSPFYDHEDVPWGDHGDTPFYNHDDTPAQYIPWGNHGDTYECPGYWSCPCGTHGTHFLSGSACEHVNGTASCGKHANCSARLDYEHNHSWTPYSYSGHSDINFVNTPHSHYYDGSGSGHYDILHYHSFSGLGEGHSDIQHDHNYGWDGADGGTKIDRGHYDILHTHTYTPIGSDRGHYDINFANTPHVNFCNHIDTGEGDT